MAVAVIEKGIFGIDQNSGGVAKESMADLIFRDRISPLRAWERVLGCQSWPEIVQETVERRFPRKGAYMQMLEEKGIVVPGGTGRELLKG